MNKLTKNTVLFLLEEWASFEKENGPLHARPASHVEALKLALLVLEAQERADLYGNAFVQCTHENAPVVVDSRRVILTVLPEAGEL